VLNLEAAIRLGGEAPAVAFCLAVRRSRTDQEVTQFTDSAAAIAGFRRIMAADPTLAPVCWHWIGVNHLNDGRPAEATAAFREAVRLNPDLGPSHLKLADIVAKGGDPTAAVAALRQARRFLPNDADAYRKHGQKLESLKDYEGAAASFQRAVELQPNVSSHYDSWSIALARDGRPARALVVVRKAMADNPDWAETPTKVVRYNAACFAALCGTGRGRDCPPAAERPRLRAEALNWLTADLAQFEKAFAAKPNNSRANVHRKITHWLDDPDFWLVRHPLALGLLPQEEAAGWRKLWADVQRLRDRTAPEVAPPPRPAP
jgi:tetratricopeptide (TPR) repeat protein